MNLVLRNDLFNMKPHDIFDTFFDVDRVWDWSKAVSAAMTLPYNIYKDENNYVVEVALAGYDKDSVDINELDGVLQIKAKMNKEDSKYVHKGITSKNFSAVFPLPRHYRVDHAEMQNGLLRITLTEDNTSIKKIKVL